MKDQKKKLVMSSEIFLLKAIRSASNTGKKSSERHTGTARSYDDRNLKHFAVAVKLFERISKAEQSVNRTKDQSRTFLSIPFANKTDKMKDLMNETRAEANIRIFSNVCSWHGYTAVPYVERILHVYVSLSRSLECYIVEPGCDLWCTWNLRWIWIWSFYHVLMLNLLSYFWIDNGTSKSVNFVFGRFYKSLVCSFSVLLLMVIVPMGGGHILKM